MKEAEALRERWLRWIQRLHPQRREETKKGETTTVVHYMRFGPHDAADWYGIGVNEQAVQWQYGQLLQVHIERVRNARRA